MLIIVRFFTYLSGLSAVRQVYSLTKQLVPKTRTQWWTDKINGNKANDEKAIKALKKNDWKIINV